MTCRFFSNTAVVAWVLVSVLVAQSLAQETAQKEKAAPKRVPVEKQEAAKTADAGREPDVIFVPTPNEVVDKMLELAEVKEADILYDLGCGDGRIVVAAAKKVGCHAIGFDIDPKRIADSKENVKKSDVEKLVKIEQEDIFTLDLSPASVVTLYLLPKLNVKLIPQLKQLKPGSRIVSHDFNMKGVEPDKVEKVTSPNGSVHTVYLWTTPLKESNQSKQ